jgi:hypothetical protein
MLCGGGCFWMDKERVLVLILLCGRCVRRVRGSRSVAGCWITAAACLLRCSSEHDNQRQAAAALPLLLAVDAAVGVPAATCIFRWQY